MHRFIHRFQWQHVLATVSSLVVVLAGIVSGATTATPVSASSTLTHDFSGFSNGAGVPNVSASSAIDMWSNWSGPSWVVRQDSVTGTKAASPNSTYDDFGTAYVLIERPSLGAGHTSADGYFMSSVEIANLDGVSRSFTLYCGDNTALTDTLAAHTYHQYLSPFTNSCTSVSRPMGWIGLTPDSDDNKIGIKTMTLDWDESGNILGANYWNAPYTITVPQGKTVYEPFIAQFTNSVNTFNFMYTNSRTGSDSAATYQLGLYDTNSSTGQPGTLLAKCVLGAAYTTTITGWTSCIDPFEQSVSLTVGNQYFLALLDITSHSGTYNTYLYGEDWAWDVNNGLVASSTTSVLPSSNPSIDGTWPDMGRHPEFYMSSSSRSTVIGNGPSSSPSTLGTSVEQYSIGGGQCTPGTCGDYKAVAEQFTANSSSTINNMFAYVNPVTHGGLDLYVTSDSSNTVGTQLAICSTSNDSTLGWHTCGLNVGVALTAGNKYWLVEGVGDAATGGGPRVGACANYDYGTGCGNYFGNAGTEFRVFPCCPGTAHWVTPPTSTKGNLLIYATN
jgi:hypothetical protein